MKGTIKNYALLTCIFLLFQHMSAGQYNTNLGYNAGDNTSSGVNNVMVGVSAGENNNGSGNIFIGKDAGKDETVSNTLIISNSPINHTIYGDLANRRVAIGTSVFPADNTYKLAIEGKVIAREYRATQLPAWPDFVFDSAYPLMPLGELENFIHTNSHLPNIPTAAQVEKEGVELAALNATLLQKIEELTLYVIDLEKENKVQDQLIKQLMDYFELQKASIPTKE